ncbi:hypothetical protein IAQ61_006529 [Plenodomus lingam]|uniref:Transcription factor IIIC 90kDa subunit N-terminal domain-containing protein n=1 Tax=Leptosphaeria maculans (strain JN3 / isolate v23.1.3 / race Av1-4-5-6-7-8) TaxID=985895 RepID=E5AFE8_LEPMJ|nr:hypothetical protein LEMA_P007240.1 [Plenodomus lingam JN3]KAH9869323.1 hypothetical protein IAQ61_006529 [Plenodomus lingam]CBY01937.1 hypothetical protein LEMA_P007240.1 [Plenodomus lingam JN3]
MADVTELRCWPSCLDAIDWSQDGIIALASDERVELLFPHTVNFERDSDVPQWQHVALKVPLFSTDELPLKEPAPLQIYSVGEEISNSVPISVAWSSLGLAKHRRCALAVLTSNLALSIWSAEGKPQDEASWNRRLIVNDALRDYQLRHANEESQDALPLHEDIVRLRSRIRAFAWAPPLPSVDGACVVGTYSSYGLHIMAVANDDNQVAFIVIHSPTSTLSPSNGWNTEVVTQISVTPAPEGSFTYPTVFEEMMEQQRHIAHLAWSPWIIKGDHYHSVVAYSTNHDVRARIVTNTRGSIELGDEVVYPNIEVRFSGPMKWSPKIGDGNELTLALFTSIGVQCLTISAHDASIIKRFTHDLDGRWDQMTGVVWDMAHQPVPKLHMSSLTSTVKTHTVELEVTSSGLVQSGVPMWRDQIENHLAQFSVKHGLKGNCLARIWGLTLSPLGDFFATSYTLHPSDMIEYGPPGDRRGIVAISTSRKYSQLRQAFPSWNVSAEGVLLTMKKLAQNAVEEDDPMSAFAEEMVEKLLQVYASPQEAGSGNEYLATLCPSNLDKLVEAFKKVAFLNRHSLRDRYTILVDQACNTAPSQDLPKTLIAYRLATALQHLPSSLSKSAFSAEIRAHHQQFVSLIDSITADATMETETTIPISSTDVCDFCSAPIPLNDLTWAACTNGHSFPRCGLSFLAIQAPGITKYCGICSTPFLNEPFVEAQEVMDPGKSDKPNDHVIAKNGTHVRPDPASDGSNVIRVAVADGSTQQEGGGSDGFGARDRMERNVATTEDEHGLLITLARVLFLACDACIYCGGKFVG